MNVISKLDMMMWIRKKITDCESEIKYLRELLIETNGPAEGLISSLHVHERMLAEYKAEYSRYEKMEDDPEVGC